MTREDILVESCDTTSLLLYRSSVAGLNMMIFCPAKLERLSRLSSSSVLPENMHPVMTSIHPLR